MTRPQGAHRPARFMPAGRRRDRLVRIAWGAVDSAVWFVAIGLGMWLRYLYDFHQLFDLDTLWAGLIAVAAHSIIGGLLGPYAKGHLRGSYEEVLEVTGTVAAVAAVVLATAFLARPYGLLIPKTVPVIAAMAAFTIMMALRFIVRAVHHRRALHSEGRQRVIVFGAGQGGRLLVRSLLSDSEAPYLPVAFLDDNPRVRRLRIEGLKVRGNRADIEKVAASMDVDHMVIAIPSASNTTIRELRDAAAAAGVKALVVPPFSALVGGNLSAGDIRDINLEDLLGRRPITLDQKAIRAHLTHRVVLVTGAGGSIGSELCRQIDRFTPARLVLVDRDESALQAVQLDLAGNGLLDSDALVLADIRDRETMRRVFLEHRPDVVFHAAALKHLPLLERYPLEAWKSNVLGTLNVLRAAAEAGVGTFVNISTDKAADATCVLGISKRIAERLTADLARSQPGRFLSVRFGNVLGSRGSVIPAFTHQIQHGGPVTITHPDVERYFMLIPEACQLVMQAAVIGGPGEVMVLNMGEQVKIREIADTLISLSGRQDVEIVYTGLRPGEKITEDLFNSTDTARVTAHPLVSTVDVPPLAGATVDGLPSSPDQAREWLRGLASHGTGPFTDVTEARVRQIRPA